MKVRKFLLDIGQLFFQSTPHRRARLHAGSSQTQESTDLAEFESQALYAADKGKCLHVGFCELTKSALRSWRSRKQCIAFVEANRINAEANLFRYYADLHLPGSFLEATPWSIVQSQGHFGRPEAPYPPQLFLESCVTALAPSPYALPLDLDRRAFAPGPREPSVRFDQRHQVKYKSMRGRTGTFQSLAWR